MRARRLTVVDGGPGIVQLSCPSKLFANPNPPPAKFPSPPTPLDVLSPAIIWPIYRPLHRPASQQNPLSCTCKCLLQKFTEFSIHSMMAPCLKWRKIDSCIAELKMRQMQIKLEQGNVLEISHPTMLKNYYWSLSKFCSFYVHENVQKTGMSSFFLQIYI